MLSNSSKFRSMLFLITAFAAGLAIPVSTSLQNISIALMCIIVLFDANLRQQIYLACKNYFIICSMLLYVFLLLWVFKSQAPQQDINHMLMKMRIFILSPLLFVYFSRYEFRLWAAYGYIVGGIVTFVLSIFMCITRVQLTRSANLGGDAGNFGDWAVFRYHTYHDYFLAIMVIGLLSLILYNRHQLNRIQIRWVWLIIVIAAIDILYLVQGRAGQILFIIMLLATTCLWNIRKGLILTLILAFVMPVIIYTSPAILGGINRMQDDMTQYDEGNARTSVGARIEFLEYSRKLIAKSPITGYGTGSFHFEYQQYTGFSGGAAPRHPHNDFYWLWVEIGVLGPLTLILITLSAMYYGWKAHSAEGKLAIVIAGSYVFGALQGGFYTDNISSSAYMVILCMLLSGRTFDLKQSSYKNNLN